MKKKLKCLLFVIILVPSVGYSAVIKLNNGDTLNIILKKQTKDSLIVEHDSLGSLTIKKDKIANLQSIDLQTIEQANTEELAENQPEDEGLFGTGFLVDWKRDIDVGVNGAAGSSDNATLRIGVSSYFEDDKDRWDFKAVYLYKQEDHETTDNQLKVDLLKDWLLKDSPWFYFASAGLDMDEFKDWDYRFRLAAGPGYQLIKNKQFELAAKAGLNGIYEVKNPDDVIELEGLIGFNLLWDLTDKNSLKFSNIFYPALTDFGEYRNVTAFEWAHKLDYYKGMAIKLGFNNEYNTKETEKNDLKYYAAFAWEL
jgi:putative salt-induced outer membrane protein YdiY